MIGDFIKDKNPTLLRALGELLYFLKGAFTIAEDVGTTAEDISVTFTPLHPMSRVSPMAVAEIPRLPTRGASIAGSNPRSRNASIPVIYEA